MSARVLVGAFSMEANSFLGAQTTRADFEQQVWVPGDQMDRDAAGPSSELAGAWDALAEAGLTPVGAIAALASPGPQVAAEVFAEVTQALLDGCDLAVDGVYLMCHGSALVVGEDDPEGALLQAIRDRLGWSIPIAVSLDLHAYLTERMVQAADIITAYRTCPHVDLHRTGYQAGALLARAIAGEVRPIVRRVRLPMITPPEHHDSGHGAFPRLQALCADAESAGALSAALLCTQPWLDVPELGWNSVVTTDDDPDLAERLAMEMAEAAWRARGEFMQVTARPLAQAVDLALAEPGPFVIADIGDATNGGAMGDSTELLRVLLARQGAGQGIVPAALSVMDDRAADAARRAGPGSLVDLTVGSGGPGDYNESTTFTGRVLRLWDGAMQYTHPATGGVVDSAGPAAVVEVGQVLVIVHSRPVRVIDPAIYIGAGIDLGSMQILQAKSHVSYRAGFDPVSTGSVLADTPGPTAADLASLPFRRRPRPMFPFEQVDWPGRSRDEQIAGRAGPVTSRPGD